MVQRTPTQAMSSSPTTSSTSSSDDTNMIALALVCASIRSVGCKKRKPGESRPGRRGNRDIQRATGAKRLDIDYFGRTYVPQPIFSAQAFERRFTVIQSIYERIRTALCSHDQFFVQQTDCCGREGASTDQKICGALRQLSSGISADSLADYFRLSESTLLRSMKSFCKGLIACFKDTYLRRPNISDIKIIESQYARLGFPGCLGCVDCSGWDWDKCPVGWQGQYTGKEGKPVLRMEVICDDKLWVLHFMFGIPGAKNDKSVMNQSTVFDDIRTGLWPPIKPNVNIGGNVIDWFYFLSDGIYPRFCIFAKPHPDPKTAKQNYYTAAHCSARKAVERLFGVLDGQFEILDRAARLADVSVLNDIAIACVILHNMIVEERGYDGTAKFRINEELRQTAPTTFNDIQSFSCSYEQADLWRRTLDPLESVDDHFKLQRALEENVWNSYGNSTN